MRPIAMMCLVFAATASAGCLRNTEFKCRFDADCGTMGACETIGYCSFPNAECAGGRSFSDSAGQGLPNTCVGATNPGLGVDAPMVDGMMNVVCPAPFATIAGSAHLYKRLINVSWDTARTNCRVNTALAYLAIPDDAAELMNLAAVAMGTPFWIGLDDQQQNGTFMTQKGVQATFLPWANGQPNQGNPPKECVNAVSATEIATERCGTQQTAVCECEP